MLDAKAQLAKNISVPNLVGRFIRLTSLTNIVWLAAIDGFDQNALVRSKRRACALAEFLRSNKPNLWLTYHLASGSNNKNRSNEGRSKKPGSPDTLTRVVTRFGGLKVYAKLNSDKEFAVF